MGDDHRIPLAIDSLLCHQLEGDPFIWLQGNVNICFETISGGPLSMIDIWDVEWDWRLLWAASQGQHLLWNNSRFEIILECRFHVCMIILKPGWLFLPFPRSLSGEARLQTRCHTFGIFLFKLYWNEQEWWDWYERDLGQHKPFYNLKHYYLMDNDNYEDDDIDDLNVWPFFSSMSYMPGWWMNAFTEKKN